MDLTIDYIIQRSNNWYNYQRWGGGIGINQDTAIEAKKLINETNPTYDHNGIYWMVEGSRAS